MRQRLHSWGLALLCSVLAACGGANGDPEPAPAQNHAPSAALAFKAGAQLGDDNTVHATVGSQIELSGTQSTDIDGDTLTYAWTLVGRPSASAATLTNAASGTSTFVPDVIGSYVVRLTVSDGKGGSASYEATVIVDNRAPSPTVVLKATFNGNSTEVSPAPTSVGTIVIMDGTGVTDPDGDNVTVTWTLTEKPADSQATLDTSTPEVARFRADVKGTFKVTGRATDTRDAWVERIYVITADNVAPSGASFPRSVIAGPGHVPIGTPVVIRASDSYSADGHALSFRWKLLTRPNTSEAFLTAGDGDLVMLTPDVNGAYSVQLHVIDDVTSATSDAVLTIEAGNAGPTVVVEPAKATVTVNQPTTVSAQMSYDAENDPLTYAFYVDFSPSMTFPVGIALPPTAGKPYETTFTPDKPGTYVIRVNVSDGTQTRTAYSVLTVQ